MSIISICILGIITSVLSLMLKKYNQEIALLIAITGCVIIFLSLILNLNSIKNLVSSILSIANIKGEYLTIILKSLAVCFLTEFTYDCCIDAGQKALANNISIAGKIIILFTAIPLYQEILNTIISLTGGYQ